MPTDFVYRQDSVVEHICLIKEACTITKRA